MAKELTKEQIASIKGYGSEIKTLKDFVTAVQKKPGMYIGYLGNRGFINMIREILQNCIDEVQRKDSPATMVRVRFEDDIKAVEIEDNGRGIPFDNIIRIFTAQHTSSNYEKKKFDYTSGTHGVGGKVTNALSEDFDVCSYVLGDGRHVHFHNGYPESKKEDKIPNKGNKQGTLIRFTPNLDVLGVISIGPQDVLNLINLILPLTNIGTRIIFEAVVGDKVETLDLVNQNGISTFIMNHCTDPIIKPIDFGDDTGVTRAHIMLTWSASSTDSISSFSNFCPVDTVESSHIKGFFQGLRKFFVPYMNKVFLVSSAGKKKKDLSIIESDVRTGLHVVLDVAHLDPVFTGQAKDVLSNEDMIPFVRDLTYKALEEWASNNPQDLQKICKFIKDQAVIRLSADKEKVKLSNNYKSSSLSGLPSKFVKPTKRWEEFFIVEGDSAGGSIKNHRNNETQGVFPIRGKILNCFEKSIPDCLKNAEVAGITAIISGGKEGNYGRNFDINKVPWKKIIASADADSAGNHINALLLRMVLRLYPQLILAGKFYRSVPPLYMAKVGKKKIYFSDRLSLVQYVNKVFSKNNTIARLDGKKLTTKEVEALLYRNIDYTYELNKIANLYKLEPHIAEMYLTHHKLPAKDICKMIHKQYRFMDVSTINGKVVCDGIANGVSNTLFIGDRMLADSADFLAIVDNNQYTEYLLNGTKATLLDIMNLYEKSKPSNIGRLKGLGEQDPDELAESVVYPGDMGNRTLIRYTMDSAMKEIEDIRYYENNKNRLLDNVVVSRLDITD